MVIIHRYLFSIFQSVCVTVSIKAEALHNEKKHGEIFEKKFEGSEKNYKKINSSFELQFFPSSFSLSWAVACITLCVALDSTIHEELRLRC